MAYPYFWAGFFSIFSESLKKCSYHMCGLVGFLGGIVTHGVEGEKALLQRMAGTLVPRGPDDGGVWCDSEQRIGLGHRRLAIVDLSSAGHQPMVSASGRYVIAFN